MWGVDCDKAVVQHMPGRGLLIRLSFTRAEFMRSRCPLAIASDAPFLAESYAINAGCDLLRRGTVDNGSRLSGSQRM